jgi:hypothetical protein
LVLASPGGRRAGVGVLEYSAGLRVTVIAV